jgi:hypothetical protein
MKSAARELVDEYAETQVLDQSVAAVACQPADADNAALYDEYTQQLASGSWAEPKPKRRSRRRR